MSIKRILAMLLSLVMVFSLLPVYAFADDAEGEEPVVEEPAPEVVEPEIPVIASDGGTEPAEITSDNGCDPAVAMASVTADEVTTYYETFAAAASAAAGQYTVVLMQDMTETYYLSAEVLPLVVDTTSENYTIFIEAPENYVETSSFTNNVWTFSAITQAVAKVTTSAGDTLYASLDGTDGAFASVNVAGKTATITLLQDITLTSSLPTLKSGADLTIDLNQKTLTCNDTGTTARAFTVTGTLTIKNGTVYGPSATTKNGALFFANGGGVINVLSGVYINRAASDYTQISRTTSGTPTGQVYVSGGWFAKAVSNTYVASGYVATGKCNDAPNSNAQYTVVSAGSYTVTYDIDGDTSIVAATAGTLGSKVTLADAPALAVGEVFTGWFLNSNLTGTELSGEVEFSNSLTLYGHIESVSSPVAEVGSDKYYSFDQAMDAVNVADSTATIKLLANVETASKTIIVASANITLDLNGYTLTCTNTDSGTNGRLFQVSGALTIKDTSVAGTGEILGPTLCSSSGSVVYLNSTGSLSISGGKITGRYDGTATVLQAGYSGTNYSSIAISDGYIKGSIGRGSKNCPISISGGYFSDEVTEDFLASGFECVGTEDTTYPYKVQEKTVITYAASVLVDGETEATNYETFGEAYAAANVAGTKSTVTLLKDVSLSSALATVAASADITLDLGGKELSCDTTSTSARAFTVSGILTIKNGTVYGPSATTKSGAVFYANSNGVINILSGTYINRATGSQISRTTGDNAGQITVSGGWFTASIGSNYLPENYKSVKVISGVDAEHTFPADAPYTVAAPCATITYDANGGNDAPAAKTGVVCVPGYNLETPVYASLSTKSPWCHDKVFLGWNTKADGTGTDYEAGMTDFVCTGDITLYAKYRAAEEADYVAKINDVGYTTLAEVFTALDDGDTLTLASDIIENVVVTKSITIDLNGHSIIGKTTGSAITVNSGLTVVIQDSSELQTGLVYGEAQNNGGAIDNKGNLTINGGTFSGFAPQYGGAIYNSNGSVLTINGGAFSYVEQAEGRTEDGKDQAVYANGSSVSVTITGGDFTGSISKGKSNTTTVISISGGTYSEDPTQYVNTDICDVTGTNPYTVTKCEAKAKIGDVEYKSADAALAKAASEDTVLCLADAAISAPVPEDVTLDLNGYALSEILVNNGTVIVYDAASLETSTSINGLTRVAASVTISVADEYTMFGGTGIIETDEGVTFIPPQNQKVELYFELEECNINVMGGLVLAGNVNSGAMVTVSGEVLISGEINVSGTVKADHLADMGSIALKEGGLVCLVNESDIIHVADFGYILEESIYSEAAYPYEYSVAALNPGSPSHEVSHAVLEIGQTVQFNYIDDEPEWNAVLAWRSSNTTVATVENGLVTAVAEGTAFIEVSQAADRPVLATYRVDVAADEIQVSVTGVRLDTAKTAVELYSTDYAKLHVLVQLPDMVSAAADKGNWQGYGEAGDDFGYAIKGIALADAKTGTKLDASFAPFSFRIVDDRTLEIVPDAVIAQHVFDGTEKVKGSYKFKLIVDFDDDITNGANEFLTDVLTVSVKKSAPKLKAAAVTLNSAEGLDDYSFAVFTGAKVTDVELYTPAKKTAKPAWADVDTSFGFSPLISYNPDPAVGPGPGAKCSGTVYLQCKLEGWAITAPVAVKVNVVNKAPALSVKVTGTIDTALEQSAVRLTPTVKNCSRFEIRIDSESIFWNDQKVWIPAGDCFDTDWDGNVLILRQNPDGILNPGTYILTYQIAYDDANSTEVDEDGHLTYMTTLEKTVKFTVKASDPAKYKLKLTQSTKTDTMFLNDRYDTANMVLTYEGAPLSLNAIDRVLLDAKSAALFDLDYDADTGLVTIKWKDGADRNLKPGSSKTVKISVFIKDNPAAKANATVSLKITFR